MEKLNYEKGAYPLYIQVKNILKKKILNKEYKYGEKIPTEFELAEQFNISRITSRQSVLELEKEKLVIRNKGQGTIVCYQERVLENLDRVESFTNEMLSRHLEFGTTKAEISSVKADRELADIFYLPILSKLTLIKRVRNCEGEPLVYFKSYFSKKTQLPSDINEYYGSLYELLKKYNPNTKIGKTFDTISVMLANNEICSHLKCKKNTAILVRTRVAYDIKNNAIEYTIAYYLGHKYSYTLQLRNGEHESE
ncbi:MAG: GntR family transcriptional regulator [Erysipelotrichaceae bacterium]